MDIRKLISTISRYENNVDLLERYIMKYYINYNRLNNIDGTNIQMYISPINDEEYIKFEEKLNKYLKKNQIIEFNVDILVNIYELLIPADEKKINGMFFTPYNIKKFIIDNLFEKDFNFDNIKICDPSCGCASFLITVSKYINKKYNVSYIHIYEYIIYGVDIYKHNIEKAKLLLELLALENGEKIGRKIKFNLVVANSLELKFNDEFPEVFERKNCGFDIVIGNPPYVRARNINDKIKKSLERWSITNIGNKDLYIAFFQLGLEILNIEGALGYISVNSYLTSLNGRLLRKYLIDNEYNMKIINFKDSQMFKGVTSYTCINLFDKQEKGKFLKYVKLEDISKYSEDKLNKFSYDELDNFNGWNLGDINTVENINKIRRFETKLEKYGIKNGIATLKNDIFIFKPYDNCEEYYYFKDINNNDVKVEKKICKKILKPNTLELNADIEEAMEYIIYPYYKENEKYKLLDEHILRSKYKFAYEYLSSFKKELLLRDKGKAIDKYPNWYAFGRTQGMDNYGYKILLPYMSNAPKANICLDDEVLFYCGYALFSNDLEELRYVYKIILSKVFWYYVRKTSKPYSGGYMSFAKNYIKDFSLPDLDDELKKRIIKENDSKKIDEMLLEIYDLDI